MDQVIKWFTENWTSVVAILWSVDQLLKIVAKLTPTKVDDNISDYIGGFLARFLPKR